MIWLQQNLSKLGSPVVLCHNDLLCKNIIYKQKEGMTCLKQYEHEKMSAALPPQMFDKVGEVPSGLSAVKLCVFCDR
ncbi:hypothetical protein DNTS_007727 [Danionella cerebrum]|uniref:Uncharacterized protein n=2 Tax=Danionella cerebrum TaxID=2873325 RepID=A0A553QU76_9TELE|nr:hypothetical protein DNTS_007727 [Danionella translucida]